MIIDLIKKVYLWWLDDVWKQNYSVTKCYKIYFTSKKISALLGLINDNSLKSGSNAGKEMS